MGVCEAAGTLQADNEKLRAALSDVSLRLMSAEQRLATIAVKESHFPAPLVADAPRLQQRNQRAATSDLDVSSPSIPIPQESVGTVDLDVSSTAVLDPIQNQSSTQVQTSLQPTRLANRFTRVSMSGEVTKVTSCPAVTAHKSMPAPLYWSARSREISPATVHATQSPTPASRARLSSSPSSIRAGRCAVTSIPAHAVYPTPSLSTSARPSMSTSARPVCVPSLSGAVSPPHTGTAAAAILSSRATKSYSLTSVQLPGARTVMTNSTPRLSTSTGGYTPDGLSAPALSGSRSPSASSHPFAAFTFPTRSLSSSSRHHEPYKSSPRVTLASQSTGPHEHPSTRWSLPASATTLW